MVFDGRSKTKKNQEKLRKTKKNPCEKIRKFPIHDFQT